LKVYQYSALEDNYHYLVYCKETLQAVAIDICDASKLFDFIKDENLKLKAILNTHHHQDHVGANREIIKKYSDVKVYGSRYDYEKKRIPYQDISLSEGDLLSFGSIKFKVIEVPGHTLGHIAYINKEMAFVGDTIFASGCGRLFEGTPSQMVSSIKKIIDNILETTKIFCAHEYTQSNLEFAITLEENYFKDYYQEIIRLRSENIPTVPTYLEQELRFNPFLMIFNPKLKELLDYKEMTEIEAFTNIRKLKDNF
jgi:hydroxyacylglutathione hydrolase